MFNFLKFKDEFKMFINWRTNLKIKNKLGDESIIFIIFFLFFNMKTNYFI